MKVTYKNVVYKISYKAFGRTRIVTSKNFELRKDAENEARLLRRGGQTDVHIIRINKTL